MEKLQTGILDEKTLALIAVETAVGTHCQPCLIKAVSSARETGATEEEIKEATAMGGQVRRGAGLKIDKLVKELLDSRTGEGQEDCGCTEQTGKCC